MNRFSYQRRGFTFLEIIVVVAILAVLATLVIPRLLDRGEEARRTTAETQLTNFKTAISLYKLDNGFYPSTAQGLKALVEQPTTSPQPKKWKKYMDEIPKDPWGNEYIYVSPAPNGDFDVYTKGADEADDKDDIHLIKKAAQ